ncbi:MAG: glycosyltransferase family 2 protein [Vicinamibacterales bacterium]
MTPPASELELSVVIPCLNESSTIGGCVTTALDAMRRHDIRGEVVVSDNGSTDGSVGVAIAAGARVIACRTSGYGAAVVTGLASARGRYLLMGDGDQSYDFALLPRFLEKARTGARFVMGSRLRGKIHPGAMPPLHRYVGTPVLTWILNSLFGTRISDCNCGMRCIERGTFLALGLTSTGMELASEMVVKAAVLGIPIDEVAINFYCDARGRRPHLRPFRDGWRHLRLLLWHAPDHMMTLPGFIMLAVGLLLAFSQLAGPVSLGSTVLDLHYMILGDTLSLVGTSAASLGLLVGATTPAGTVRHLKMLKPVHRGYTIDTAALAAGLLFSAGLAVDGSVLAYWLVHDRGELGLFFTRLTLCGLLLIGMSVQIGLSALVVGLRVPTKTPASPRPRGATDDAEAL